MSDETNLVDTCVDTCAQLMTTWMRGVSQLSEYAVDAICNSLFGLSAAEVVAEFWDAL